MSLCLRFGAHRFTVRPPAAARAFFYTSPREHFGKSGIDAISRLMGFLLVCMGIQFIINGILEIITTQAALH
jgi:Multiple antibiotic transporter